jgi:hypothetical protein
MEFSRATTNAQLNVQFLREALYHELGFRFLNYDKLGGEHDYFSTKGILCSGIFLIAGSA